MHKTTTRSRRHTNNLLHNDIEKLKAILADAAFDAKGRANELLTESWENMKDKSAELQDNVNTFATKKPYKTAGIALLVGLAIGYLIHR